MESGSIYALEFTFFGDTRKKSIKIIVQNEKQIKEVIAEAKIKIYKSGAGYANMTTYHRDGNFVSEMLTQ